VLHSKHPENSPDLHSKKTLLKMGLTKSSAQNFWCYHHTPQPLKPKLKLLYKPMISYDFLKDRHLAMD
jgi:hypothetical protein